MLVLSAAQQMDAVMRMQTRPAVLVEGMVADDECIFAPASREDAGKASSGGDHTAQATPATRLPSSLRPLSRRRAAQSGSSETLVRFNEQVLVQDYEVSADEREQKRRAFREVARRKQMRRQRPLQPHLQGDLGDLLTLDAASPQRRLPVDRFETPATPMHALYASSLAQHRDAANLPRARGARLAEARVDARPRSSSAGDAVTLARPGQAARLRRQQELQQRQRKLMLQRRGDANKALPATYWELLVAVLLFIKLLTHVLASVAGGSEENASRAAPHRRIAYS